MTQASEIKDCGTLQDWLAGRSRADATAIAHRAAMRVMPLFGEELEQIWAQRDGASALDVLRPCFLSGVAAIAPSTSTFGSLAAVYAVDYAAYAAYRTVEVEAAEAARAAARAAVATANIADDARFENYPELHNTSVEDISATSEMWKAVRSDAESM